MKWFKHYSDMYRGQSINKLMDELGHTGLCFFILQEMCAEKLEKNKSESVTLADCSFRFHTRVVRQNLRIGAANLRQLLNLCQEVGLLSFEIDSNSIQISMPILLNLLDRDSISARKTRAKHAQNTRSDKEKEKEKEKELDKDKELAANQFSAEAENHKSKKGLSSEQKDLNKRIWESYRNAYLLRHKVEPVRNATVNGQISMLRTRLGEEAVHVVSFYLTSNLTFYVSKFHPIGLCLQDAEALRTQMLKGTAITTSMVKNFEKNVQSVERDQQIKNMWKDEEDAV